MRRIEKAEDSTAVRADIVVDDPAFLVVAALFVVGLTVFVLVERLGEAFVEYLFGVLRARGPLCSRDSVGESELFEKLTEVDWVILNIELFGDEMLYLLFFPGLSFTEEFEQFLLLVVAELRGPAGPEVRREQTESSFVPAASPATAGGS